MQLSDSLSKVTKESSKTDDNLKKVYFPALGLTLKGA